MRILLADEHRMIRDGLKAILEKEGLQIVDEVTDSREVVQRSCSLHPEVVVMGVSMQAAHGVDATRQLVADAPWTKVIALTVHSDRQQILTMFAAGAVGCLLTRSAGTELIEAVHVVTSGHRYVSPAIAHIILDNLVDCSQLGARPSGRTPPGITAIKPLSGREREVLQLLAEGRSSKEIAVRLCIATSTIDTHRRQIMDKLGLRTIAELTKYAIREGLTSLE